MDDTLRSIVEELLSRSQGRSPVAFSSFDTERKLTQLLALLAEYEKVDPIQRMRKLGGVFNEFADELVQWLAVNLERIRAEARLEEAKWWWGMYTEGAPAVCDKRIAALEA